MTRQPRENVSSGVSRPGGISYLRIPSSNPAATASFFEDVFGWKVDRERDDPSFEDGTGHVIGHIHGDMDVAGEAGVRPYVYVDSVEGTIEKIAAAGGEVVTAPYPEGNLTVGVLREPGGSILGIWQAN